MALDSSDDVVKRRRGCTDAPCLILLVAMMGAMGYVSFLALMAGDPLRLVYGSDSWGNTCNRKNSEIENSSLPAFDLREMDNVFYFDFSNPKSSVRICVDRCPNETLGSPSQLTDYYDTYGTRLCRYDVLPASYSSDENICPTSVTPCVSVLLRCVPESAIEAATSVLAGGVSGALDALHAQCDSAGTFFVRAAGDIGRTREELLGLCAMAVGFALLFTFLMRWFAAIIIWALVLTCSLGLLGAAGYSWYAYVTARQQLDEIPVDDRLPEENDYVRWWLIEASCVSVAAVIVLLVLLVLRKRIALVVQLFKEAGKALGKMPLLLLQPICTMLVLVGTMALFLSMGLFIETAADPTVDQVTQFVTYNQIPILTYLRWLYLFGALWIIQLIFACHQMIVASAVVIWYFTRDKSKLGWPILVALGRVFKHLGSLAFGALLIAMVQMARIILGYIEKKTSAASNSAIKCVFRAVQCCLWCFEKFIKFMNQNAYIMMAIQGTNFCISARDAFCLMLRNVLRVAAVNSVGTFVLFLGKVGVTAVTVAVGWRIIQTKADICYPWIPIAMGGIFAFFIADTFLSVYATVIDAVLLCFCKDLEDNDGDTKPFYMSKDLMAYVNKTNREDKKKTPRRNQTEPGPPGGASQQKPQVVDW